jgi:hypothetical protein
MGIRAASRGLVTEDFAMSSDADQLHDVRALRPGRLANVHTQCRARLQRGVPRGRICDREALS